MELFERAIHFIKLKPPQLVMVLVFCGTFLFIPDKIKQSFRVLEAAQNYAEWFGIAFFGATSILLVQVGEWVVRVIRNTMREKKRFKLMEQTLERLTEEEKQILRFYFLEETKTNVLNFNDGVVLGLQRKGIIQQAGNYTVQGRNLAYNISELAWDYLHENHDLLQGTTNLARTDKVKW